ncbi:odorant receptor 13a-like [Ptiloglossa arizonensis]|uniref:odorant receptor 13a-like n=1 Tax=Ptiloglossa arizonensis TaxID=3350558 RepID=UPI003F9F73B6
MSAKTYTDVSIRLSAFFMRFVGLWTWKNDKEQRWRNVTLGYTIWSVCLGIFIEIRDLYYSRHDFSAFLYITCNVLSTIMVLIKLLIILIHRMEFLELILFMEKHFWNAEYDYHEKNILASVRRTCISFTIVVTLTGHGAIMGYLITPIIHNMGKNESDRILPFNMWLNWPLAISPYFELMFFVQVITLYSVGISYFCFDNILCIINVHTSGQFRILQYRLTKLYQTDAETKDQNGNTCLKKRVNKSYEILKNCVRQHQSLIDYCMRLENVFTLVILAQVLIFSVLICLFGYQIFLAQANTARRSIFIFLITGSMSLLLMFTYSCHGLIEQSDKVGVAAYSAPWTLMPMNKVGRMLRNDLMMVIVRSKRVCCVTANGFFPISLDTYSTIISTAMSYFTLLRQRSEEVDETSQQ